jgi:hypothetical protein
MGRRGVLPSPAQTHRRLRYSNGVLGKPYQVQTTLLLLAIEAIDRESKQNYLVHN